VYGNDGWPFLEENCYHVVQEALLEKQEEEEKLQLQVLQKKQQQQEEEEEQQQQQDDEEEEAQVSSLYLYFPVLIFVDVIVQCVTLTIYARLCCFSWQ
jgi:uncharacterized membrane protein YdbT with pleckstrin-like domain